tara:strand:+ start:4337 stop:5644 length:1308 start_codon:yes stop_codon:yes gene_type:complete
MSADQNRKWLETNVSLFSRMPADLQNDLLVILPSFIAKVGWQGKEGLQITDEMKVCIAAEACIPLLRMSGGLDNYQRLKLVEVFPEDLAKVSAPGVAGDANYERVRLGWRWAREGMENGEDGYNLIIHEFAHIIDFASMDGQADGVPRFESYREIRDWERFVSQNYEDFQRELGSNNESFSDYGSSNEAEFFACATESFFERGAKFHYEWPEIYDRLKDYYGVDPKLWVTGIKIKESESEVQELVSPEISDSDSQVEILQNKGSEDDSVTELEAESPAELKEQVEDEQFKKETEEQQEIQVKSEQIEESDLLSVKVDARGLGNITEYHANGVRAFLWEVRDFINEGPWRRWNNKGDLVEEGWCRKGVRDGRYKLNHLNGKTKIDGTYRNDKRDGKWRVFGEDGALLQENHYQQGDLIKWEVWSAPDQSNKYGGWS